MHLVRECAQISHYFFRTKERFRSPFLTLRMRHVQRKERRKCDERAVPLIKRLVREHPQILANSAIPLVQNNVIPVLIGPLFWPSLTLIMDSLGEGTRPCLFPVTGNGHGWVPSPRESMIKAHDVQNNGPIRTGMTLFWTNLIARFLGMSPKQPKSKTVINTP